MHSTTADLGILLQTFPNGGAYAGKRVFSPATVAAMTRNQNEGIGSALGPRLGSGDIAGMVIVRGSLFAAHDDPI